MVELVPMTEIELRAFLDVAIRTYADEHVKSGDWHPDEALGRSEAEFHELLPSGLATPNQYLFSIRDPASAENVGILWFHARHRAVESAAFIYNIEIYPPFQRRGYASQALMALEARARALGLSKIELHVFGHNTGARALYEKLGFAATHAMMAKSLSSTEATPL